MKIEIESRKSITTRAQKPFPEHTALISIADLDVDFAELKNKPEYLLQLRFCDATKEIYEKKVDNERIEGFLGRKLTLIETFKLMTKYPINDEQAAEIAAFVKSILGSAEVLICQCDYGISRSAGVAAAVKQFLTGDGNKIFEDKCYEPNKLVYRKVFEALEREA